MPLSSPSAESNNRTCILTSSRLVRCLLILGVAASLMSFRSRGQQASSPIKPGAIDARGPVEVLSDTKGFNMKPYVKDLSARVKATWLPLVPNAARKPIFARGHLAIDFRVMKDGHVEDIRYHGTSGNESLDRAAYGAITGSSPMPPLPAEFQCQSVRMRVPATS